jgi:hypothetical protein
MKKLNFDDLFERSLNILALIGAILGAIIGFTNAGIGGAILGIILGGIVGLLLCLGLTMIGLILAEPVFWIITGIIVGVGLIIVLINVFWNVGKP